MSTIRRLLNRKHLSNFRSRIPSPIKLDLQRLEARENPAPVPNVSVATTLDPFIGQQNVPVAVTFTNATADGATQPGFGPWTYVVLPASGSDGNDGITYGGGATYLGAPITGTVLTAAGANLTASGAAASYALNSSGNPITITGLTAGDQVVFFQLPYISFSLNQPGATVKFNANVSNLADLGKPLTLRAGGGFTLGADALNNPGADAPIVDPTPASVAVTPELVRITKTYNGPEQETATGPNYTRSYTVRAFVAPGQTITGFQLRDLLDNGMQYRPDIAVTSSVNGGAFTNLSGTTANATTPGGTVVGNFTQVVGDASDTTADASLTFSFFVPRNNAGSSNVVPIGTGAFQQLTDVGSARGTWDPIDARDPLVNTGDAYWTAAQRNPVDTITAKSIAAQKGVTVVGGTQVQQGAVLEYTINFQVSDYFAFDQLNVPDILPDGTTFDATFNPTLSVSNPVGPTFTGNFAGANYAVGGFNADGTQSLNFDVSSQIGGSGRMVGGWIPGGGTGGPVPDTTTFGNAINPTHGPATGTIVFRARVNNLYRVQNGGTNVKQGDSLTNLVPTTTPIGLPGGTDPAGGRVLQFSDAATPTGNQRADDTQATVTVPKGTFQKTIYAVNDVILPGGTTPILQDGDKVTYRLVYSLPTGSAQNFVITDYLPLPVYNATSVTTGNFTNAFRGTTPAVGTVNYGPTTTAGNTVAYGDGTIAGQNAPTLSTDATANTVKFTFPTILQDAPQRTTVIDLLLSVTFLDVPYADGFPLTNQANAVEANSPNVPTPSDVINQVLAGRPLLNVTKGVVSTDRAGFGPFGNGGVTFGAPGSGSAFAGTLTSNGLNGSNINSNLSGIDAGDQVRFAVTVENRGSGPRGAYDVVVKDTQPTGFLPAPGGLNLQFRDGTGAGGNVAAAIAAGYTFFDSGNVSLTTQAAVEAAFFSATGVRLSGGPTNATADGTNGGVIDGFNSTSGRNILIATYDLRTIAPPTANAVNANQTLTNTAQVTRYAGQTGGNDQSQTNVGNLTDTANVVIANPSISKTLIGTSINETNNSNTQAVIGEIATYQIRVQMPEGISPGASIGDFLPAGMVFVDVLSVATDSGITLTNPIGLGSTPANVAISNQGRNVLFNTGTITNTNTDNVARFITIQFRAVVTDVASNVQGTALSNRGRINFTGEPGAAIQSTDATLRVIEPNLGLAKSVTVNGVTNPSGSPEGQRGDAIQYDFTINPLAGRPIAYNSTFRDNLPLGFGNASIIETPVLGNFSVVGGPVLKSDGTTLALTDFEIVGSSAAGYTVQSKPGVSYTIAPTQSVSFRVSGTISINAITNSNVANTGTVDWQSISGATAGQEGRFTLAAYDPNNVAYERTGSTGDLGGAANTYVSSSTATFRVLAFTPTKLIVATSEFSTPESGGTSANPRPVEVGEIVRYRTFVQIAQGTTPSVSIRDTLPAGLQFLGNARYATVGSLSAGNPTLTTSFGAIFNADNTSGTVDPANLNTLANGVSTWTALPNGQVTVAGQTVTLDLGTLTNNDADPTRGEYIVVEFNALVRNVVANTGGAASGRSGAATQLDNSFAVLVNGTQSGGASNVASVVVVEANVAIAQTIQNITAGTAAGATAVGDAGDLVEYVLTLANNGNATAFNLLLNDLLPSQLSGATITSVVGSGLSIADFTISGSTLQTASANGVDLPTSVTIRVRGTLAQSVRSGQTLTNPASLTYSSLPGTGSATGDQPGGGTGQITPGASAAANGERNGADGIGGALNNYTATSNTSISVPNGTITKSLASSTLAATTGANLAIGEVGTYRLDVTLPESTATPVILTDVLPLGMVYIPGSVVLIPGSFNGSFTNNPPAVTYVAATRTLTIDFGVLVTANDNNTGNNSFAVTYDSRVVDAPTNEGILPGQTSLSNTARLNADTAPPVNSNPVVVAVVEPQLQVVKTLTNAVTANAGDTKTYSVVVTHTGASTGAAYNVAITDPLASIGLGLNLGSVTFSVVDSANNPVGYAPTITNTSTVAGGLNLLVSELRLGDKVLVAFSANVNGPGAGAIAGVAPVPAPGSTVTNTVNVDYRSAPPGPDSRDEPDVQSTAAFTVKSFALGGSTFRDLNNNGLFDGTDSLIAGQNITYRLIGQDSQGNAVDLTLTTSNGLYNFTGLRPGAYRVVQQAQPTGFLDGKDTSGGAGATDATPFGGTGAAPSRTGKTDPIGAVGGDITGIVIPTSAADGTAGLRYNFGELPAASLGDVVWEDTDGDGIQDNLNGVGGEAGLGGIAVILNGTDDLGAIAALTATTTALGAYGFNNLRPGTYVVTFGNTAGATTYAFTAPNAAGSTAANDSNANRTTGQSGNVTLIAGQNDPTIDAGVSRPVTIGDTVWYDTNADGILNGGELGIPGVLVTLTGTDGAGNPINATATTNASGLYSFTGLPPGSYTVAATPTAGSATNTTPLSQPTGVLPSGAADLNRDFGFRGVGTIGDEIFLDQNNDGTYQVGEGLNGVRVRLIGDLNNDGTNETYTTTTNASGFYQFINLRTATGAGANYSVIVDTATLPQTGAGTPIPNTVDPDGGFDSQSVLGLTTAAPNNPNQDFGYRNVGRIGDTVFLDSNNDGLPNSGEGIANVRVRLIADIDADGTLNTFTATTDANGNYLFDNLPVRDPNGVLLNYRVAVDTATLPAGLTNAVDPDGGANNFGNLSLNPASPTDLNQDFGYRGLGAIGDTVFLDLNSDGLPQAGEGLSGIRVLLIGDFDGNGVANTLTTTTDANGLYGFSGLVASNIPYTVTVDTNALPKDGNSSPIPNTTDPDGSNDSTSALTLTNAAPVNLAQDFGYRGPGRIGDTVFLDQNADGLPQANELLPNVVVRLSANIDGTLRTFTQTTNAGGIYDFSNLPVRTAAGTLITYTVDVDPTTLPQGVTNTVDPDGGVPSRSTLTLNPAAPVNLNQDFGYRGPGRIGDTVFLDQNADGTPQSNEVLPNVVVRLSATIDGTAHTFTATTNASGVYDFSNLPILDKTGTAISYTVSVDTSTIPQGATNTVDPDGGVPGQSVLTLSNASPINLNQDFGYRGPGEIGDTVFWDQDGNGAPQANEVLPNVVVRLSATIDGTAHTFTRTTNAAGVYDFSNLPVVDRNGAPLVYTVAVDTTAIPQGIFNIIDPDGGNNSTSTLVLTNASPINLNQDFGYRGPGQIGDTVFLDQNADGTPQANEVLPNVVVRLSATFDGTAHTFTRTTDAAGLYLFGNLPIVDRTGTLIAYTVAVDTTTIPQGVTNTVDPDGGAPSRSSLTLNPAGPTDLNQDFGYRGPGQIGDTIFLDQNADGLPQTNELLPNVVVRLTATIDGTEHKFTRATDVNGRYDFSNLPILDKTGAAITYFVDVEISTLPQGVVNTVDPDGGFDSVSVLTLSNASPINLNQDFGYRGPGRIGDTIFLDQNANGTPQANELLPNVAVRLSANIDGTDHTFTRTTDAAGQYDFGNLPILDKNGTPLGYTVTVDTTTLPQGIANTVDPDGGTPSVSVLTLSNAQPNNLNQDFGYRGLGLIGDTVFFDQNANGAPDASEQLVGVAVRLSATIDGTAHTFTFTTDANGNYAFGNLPVLDRAGAPIIYTVTVDPTTLPQGIANTVDPDGGTPSNSVLTLNPGSPVDLNQDFGYRGPGQLGDRVFLDVSNDGIWNPGEGITGVGITLTADVDANGTLVTFTATTDATGFYRFDNLPTLNKNGLPIDYTVAVRQTDLPQNATNTADPDGGANSTSLVNLTVANPVDLNQDFGYQGPGQIGDRVFLDLNNDGIWNPGEGITGINVTIRADVNGDGINDLTLTATTDDDGGYLFQNLAVTDQNGNPITYTVTIDPTNLPSGVTNTVDPDGGTVNSSILNLTFANPVNLNQDFGYRGTGALGDRVWIDANGDGVQDSAQLEPGVPFVRLQLTYLGQDGTFGTPDDITASVTADANGLYNFANLPGGTFRVTVDPTSLPTNFLPTYDLDGTGTADQADAVLANGQTRLDADFGYRSTASLGDRVWLDENRNGAQDPAERGIPGAVVLLEMAGADGDVNSTADNIRFTATTGADGLYTFQGLPVYGASSSFRATVISLPITGLVPTIDLDSPLGAADHKALGTLGANQNHTDADFGYGGIGTIAGTVFFDRNNNGVQDPGENGLPGVALTLTGRDILGNPIVDPVTGTARTATTNAQGGYLFDALTPGTYTVSETQPTAYNDGIDSTGSLGGNSTVNDVLSAVTVGPGQNGVGYNFGEIGTELSGYVFLDSNRDGNRAGDTPIPNTAVTLLDSNGATLSFTTTDANGYYQFANLLAGNYTVVETQPAAFGNSPNTPATVRAVTLPLAGLTEQNFGETLGFIGGTVYRDFDDKGALNLGDGPIPNTAVILRGRAADGEVIDRTAFTNFNGNYRFEDLKAADANGYTLIEIQPAPFTDRATNVGTLGGTGSTNLIERIALPGGGVGTDYNFGEVLVPPVPGYTFLSGSVYRDDNRDGTRQSAEPGIANVPVELLDTSGNVLATATTDGNGFYSFGFLTAGQNYTIREIQPAQYGDSPASPTRIIPVANLPVTGLTDQNFGETLGSLSGTVYFDTNNNGLLEAGETAIANATVTLTGVDATGLTFTRVAQTDLNGNYLFDLLPTGTYSVVETQPPTFVDGKDALGSAGGNPSNDRFDAIQLPGGARGVNYNFGEIGVPVSGTVFVDANRNGGLDGGEKPIPGTVIQLIDANGTVVLSTTTDAGGNYRFNNVPPGGYTIRELQPVGYGDPPAGPFALNTRTITVATTPVTQQNFGDTLSTLSGGTYVDGNNDGLRQVGEPGIGGVKVVLTGTDVSGNAITRTAYTEPSGGYAFDNLPAGTYRTAESQPAPYLDGKDTAGTTGGTATNDLIDLIPVPAGGDSLENNFFELAPATPFVSGNVYLDSNNDGARNSNERGLSGVIVVLNGPGGPQTATTDADGNYLFTNLVTGGTYTIIETQPALYGNGAENPTNQISIPSLPATGSTNNNFGEIAGRIAGQVTYDRDGTGTTTAGDPAIAGVVLTLLDGSGNPLLDPASGLPVTTTTDTLGNYEFTGLPAGSYQVVETQPSGYFQGNQTPGNFSTSTAVDRTDIVLPAAGTSLGNDFRELGTTLSGVVFLDRSRDGDRTNDPGLVGVVLTLLDGGGNPIATTTTAPDGSYVFTNVLPGTYTVVETQPTNFSDSPGTPAVAQPVIVTGPTTEVNFGEITNNLSGTVFVDRNNDGVRQATEQPIPNATIVLTGIASDGSTVTQTVATDFKGDYTFGDLPNGTFTVQEIQPPAWGDGRDTLGTVGGIAGNDLFQKVQLGGGVEAQAYDFGEVGATIFGGVYVDANNDGIRQATETAIPNALVVLTGTGVNGQAVNQTGTTDANGNYRFTFLPAGTYSVQELQPSGNYFDGKDTPGNTGGTAAQGNADNDAIVNLSLDPGGTSTANNFGELLPASLAGFVYADANNDGVAQSTETRLLGVAITLTGTDDRGNAVNLAAQTDSNGDFSFTQLRLGIYAVIETQPSAYLDGIDTAGTGGGTAQQGTADNDKISSISIVSGANFTGYQFGEILPSKVSGVVYQDRDKNGTKSADEPGIPGTTVVLTGTDDRGQPVRRTITTDSSGQYLFDTLRPGQYTLTETQPLGYGQGTNAVGTAGGNLGGTDVLAAITLTPGTSATDYQFGETGRRADPVPTLPALPPLSETPSKTEFLGSTSSAGSVQTSPNYSTFGSVSSSRPTKLFATADGTGGSLVRVFDATNGAERFRLNPFPGFPGGARVALGDVTGDGIQDIVVGAGPGGAPVVVVYDGNTGQEIQRFIAFESFFSGGTFVAVGDINGDGQAEIAVSADRNGGPRVRVFSAGNPNRVLSDFWGIIGPDFRGGARVAIGDVNNDGTPDLVVTAGAGGPSLVSTYDGRTVAVGNPTKLFADFSAFEVGLSNGVYATVADVDGDGFGDLIVGAGEGGGPRVTTFSGAKLVGGQTAGPSVWLGNFFAYTPNTYSGVRVAATDLNGDGRAELLVATGTGVLPRIRVIDPITGKVYDEFAANWLNAANGLFVGA